MALPVAALGLARPALAADAAFGDSTVRDIARDLAARAYQPPVDDLPKGLELGYDAYRDLRFSPARSIWRDQGLPFQLQMFHRGGMARDPVMLFEVAGGAARPIAYRPDLFTFGAVRPGPLGEDLGFAGFRVHSQIIIPGRFDEVIAFLGASYFRAVSTGTQYGLSARGLGVGAGQDGEEFPAFRAFWIERPAVGAQSLTIHALMDSPSVAGAYRFVVAPGEPTRVHVTLSLFPRVTLARAGIAPLTSMFLFGPGGAGRFGDFRPRVHDSEGLLIVNGQGERIWRPLSNPTVLQTSAFLDSAPQGFGLMQRERALTAYQDLEARYHDRPGAWVTPIEGFDEGDVRLSELPARTEAEDNIVACWRPARPLAAGVERRFAYRLDWGVDPAPADNLAKVGFWGVGLGGRDKALRAVIDFTPTALGAADVQPDVRAATGEVRNIVVQANPAVGGLRLSFEFDPAGTRASDLRAVLNAGGRHISEVWTHRWLA